MNDQVNEKNQSLPDPASMSFEAAMAELENVVRRLERGDVPLDEAVKIYERGSLLKARCESKLAEAEGKVQKLILQRDGTVEGAEPFGSA